MAFQTYCNNKGCNKEQEPLLNLDTNEVECSICGKSISTITPFAKAQMKTIGQIKRKVKGSQAFSVECKQCKKTATPKIVKGKAVCVHCDSVMDHLSDPFVAILKNYVK